MGAPDRVTLHTRSYYSTLFLAAAQDAADRAEDVEDRLIAADETRFSLELRGHVLSAVILSVAFIEATINEALQDAHDDHRCPGANQGRQRQCLDAGDNALGADADQLEEITHNCAYAYPQNTAHPAGSRGPRSSDNA